MKQTKKLTRNQKEFLTKKGVDYTGVRCVEETNSHLIVMFPDESVWKYSKEV